VLFAVLIYSSWRLVLTVVVIYTLLLAAVIFVKSDLSERFNDRHRKQ
jgi:ABC-type multidrug transport system fused ATPase/permease subunit